MLFDYRFQWTDERKEEHDGCDLMLFDYRFQSPSRTSAIGLCCDLMLFDYRFQFVDGYEPLTSVVI